MRLTGMYHWVNNISGGFNWFAGLGGQVGLYEDRNNRNNDGTTLGVGAQLGIEYDFNGDGAPIQLGLDTRPIWRFVGGTDGLGYGGAFSLRFTF